MTLPCIHLNGTSGEELLEGYRDALSAVNSAIVAVSAASPNARDYYVLAPDAWSKAMQEQQARLLALQRVYNELMELAEHCSNVLAEREARKAEREAVRG